MVDRPVPVDGMGLPVENRIIGVELRLVSPTGRFREEIALVPCDVRYPFNANRIQAGSWQLNATVHCSGGDANFPVDAQLPR